MNIPNPSIELRTWFSARTLFQDFLTYLPRGNSLPTDVWLTRHRAILWLVWIQAACLFGFTLVQGYSPGHALFEASTIVIVPSLVESFGVRNQTARSTAASFGLITSSAVMTHLSGGYIEAHFHFFVMLAVIALYQSWVPFLVSILYVLVHHGVGGWLDPTSVYNHPDALANPWTWASIHAAFVSAACACYIVAWRWNESAQAHSRHILNAAGEGIVGLDPAGKILFANPAAEQIMGRETAGLLGMPLEAILEVNGYAVDGRTGGAGLNAVPEDALMEGVLHRGSESIPLDVVRTVIRERPRTTRDVFTIRDISARKAAEKALRESEQRFRSLVHNGSDIITVIAPDTTIRYQSPSIERLLGLSAAEMLGKKLLDLFHPETRPTSRLSSRTPCPGRTTRQRSRGG